MTLSVGGTFALTGAYAEDCAAVLAGFEDYVKYVNEKKVISPWYTDKTIPANITFELLWGDDALAPDKTLAIYDDLKSKGMLVERVSGSPEGMAVKDKLIEDNIGATSQSTSPAYLNPPGNIFTNAPIYTDQLAAIADWFKENWKDTSRAPRVAYLTADSTLGRNIDIPEMRAYLEGIGYEFVGAQYVPMVPTAPPTTQLAWLKDNKVDLALGIMINPGAQPTIKEATRLGMGPDLDYKITFGFAYPAHLQVFVPAMGETGNGVVVAGDFCAHGRRRRRYRLRQRAPAGVSPGQEGVPRHVSVRHRRSHDPGRSVAPGLRGGGPRHVDLGRRAAEGLPADQGLQHRGHRHHQSDLRRRRPRGCRRGSAAAGAGREDRRARIVSAARHHPEVAASSSVGAPSRGPQRFTVGLVLRAPATHHSGISTGARRTPAGAER